MTGPEHYREAERLLAHSKNHVDQGNAADDKIAELAAAQAQVHATLALAAATEAKAGFSMSDDDVMRCAHGAIICGLCGYGVPAGMGGAR